jgi:TonB family protein
MIGDLFVANLIAWTLQALCVTLAGAALPAMLRLDAPGVRYVYWRTLLGLSVALPFLQPRHAVAAVTSITASSRVAGPGLAGAAEETAFSLSAAHANWMLIVLAVLAAGAIVRVAWIVFGLLHLRRLRSAGEDAVGLQDYEELQRLIGARAELRYVPGIKQPVTFGMKPAVVLLPEMLRRQSAEVQRAVLAHELFHVQRHDWAWLLVEELVRAVFWFHPAVWWLVSRIQLTREEVVDEMALLVAGRRSTYVEALLAFADNPPFTPVAAFARRRHLFRRIALISKEAAMSSKRLIVSCAAMAMVVATGGWYATAAFPLQQSVPHVSQESSAGAPEQQANTPTPENPVPRRVNYVEPVYPPEAAAAKVRGMVSVQVTLGPDGSVAEAKAVAISLRSDASGFTTSFHNVGTDEIERFVGKATAGPNMDRALMSAAIKALIQSARDAIAAWRYEPPYQAPLVFTVTVNFSPDGKVVGGKIAHAGTPPPPPPPPPAGVPGDTVSHMSAPPPPPPPPPAFDGPALRVGAGIRTPTKIHDVKPVYPPVAAEARVQGVVIVEVRIDEDGNVSDARILRSIPLLDEAALEAVQQWKFTPTLMNGKPVPIIMTVTVNFTLE